MTVSSPGAAAGGGGLGRRGSPVTPGSRRASASAIASVRGDRLAGDGGRVGSAGRRAPAGASVGAATGGLDGGGRCGRRGRRRRRGGGDGEPARRGGDRRRDRRRPRRRRPASAGSGDVSTFTLTASWTSDEALRNSRMLLPSDGADLGQLARAEDEERDHQDDDELEGPMFGMVVVLLRVRRFAAISASESRSARRPLRAARVAQGVARPSRGRPPRGARRGRPDGRRRPSPAAAGDPARHVDQQPAAGPGRRPAPRSPDRRARTGSISPPWAPTPGTRKASPGATARIAASSAGRGRADDEADRPAGTPAGRAPRDPQVERLGGRAGRRVGRDDEVLELGRRRGSRSGTGRRRSDRRARAAARSPRAPRYGLTVTASAPRPSNSATAWRAAVEPMSPRLASATTGMSAGMRRADPLERGQPGRPEAPRRTRGSA